MACSKINHGIIQVFPKLKIGNLPVNHRILKFENGNLYVTYFLIFILYKLQTVTYKLSSDQY